MAGVGAPASEATESGIGMSDPGRILAGVQEQYAAALAAGGPVNAE